MHINSHPLRQMQQSQIKVAPSAISSTGLKQLRHRHSHSFVSSPNHGAFRFPRKEQQLCDPLDAESSSVGSGWMDMPESQVPSDFGAEVFPRLKERDPYKLLGLSREASFEEVQEARNYLYEQYKAHARSKEAIELAFDSILQQKMKNRHKFGFKPPTRGKKGELAGDGPKLSLWQQIREKFEPNVPGTTIVNDGSIFLALGVWAAWQAASSDPTLPLGAAFGFCVWKLYDKRNKRDPDGPHMGGSAIWGALGSTILGIAIGGLVSMALVQGLPWLPSNVSGPGMGVFFIVLSLGFTCIFLK